MTTCIDCLHWNPQGTDRSMFRLGFAQCKKKALPGHTTSALAAICDKFTQLEQSKVQERTVWLKKQRAIA